MTRACTLSSVLIALNGMTGPHWFQAHDATIYPGYIVEYNDADEVTVCATNSALPGGVADCPSYHDDTVVFSTGDEVPVWLVWSGVDVWVTHDGVAGNGTLAVKLGDVICRSNSTAGLVEVATDVNLTTFGRCIQATTITNASAKNIRMRLAI